MHLCSFKHNDVRYEVLHDSDTDARHIVDAYDTSATPLFTITNSLWIFDREHAKIGSIASVGVNWVLQLCGSNDELILGVVNNFHWKALQDAEVKAIQLILDRKKG